MLTNLFKPPFPYFGGKADAAEAWLHVPGNRGGWVAYMPNARDLFGEWEVFDPFTEQESELSGGTV